jgi:hypothetical protein
MAQKTAPLKDALETLRSALEAKYPGYAKSLAKPASPAARKKALGAKVPAELAELWSFADGADELFVSPGCDGMDFLSVEGAASVLAELTELAVGFPQGAFPFAQDGAGNFVGIDARGALFDWDHETREAKPIKKSLGDLVQATASAAKRGKFRGGPEVVARPNALLAKARKLIEADARGCSFKVSDIAAKLSPEDGVAVLRALVEHPEAPPEAQDHLALALARAGCFEEAIAHGVKGRFRDTSTLHQIGERALLAYRYAEAEQAFAAIKNPQAFDLIGIAVAQKGLGKNLKKALERTAQANEASARQKPIDWTSASSCYHHAGVEVYRAMILALEGDFASAAKLLADARETFAQVVHKGAREECQAELANPSDPSRHCAVLARLCGL